MSSIRSDQNDCESNPTYFLTKELVKLIASVVWKKIPKYLLLLWIRTDQVLRAEQQTGRMARHVHQTLLTDKKRISAALVHKGFPRS